MSYSHPEWTALAEERDQEYSEVLSLGNEKVAVPP